MNKADFIAHLHRTLTEKLNNLQRQIDEIKEALSEDTKSTAGDKHETSRSMAQLEQEKLGMQYLETRKLQEFLTAIADRPTALSVDIGSLVNCSQGWYYLGIPLGKVPYENTVVFCISAASPIGKILLGKRPSEAVDTPAGKLTVDFIL